MNKEEFEAIIKPIMLLNGKESQSIRTALLGKFQKWNEKKQCDIHVVSKRFIVEVFLNSRKLEQRFFDNKMDVNKELIELKKTYDNSKYVFYKGELNVC